jgi:transcriptional regulator with PAS, ATPase and Fis domain
MAPVLQAKLLHVLQDNEYSRLGGKKNVVVDVRILAATNQNLEEAMQDGRFREDLFYRLNVVNVSIPPLRERREEIPSCVTISCGKHNRKYNSTC